MVGAHHSSLLELDVQGVAEDLNQGGHQGLVLQFDRAREVGLVFGWDAFLLLELQLQVVDCVRALHIELHLIVVLIDHKHFKTVHLEGEEKSLGSAMWKAKYLEKQ